MKEKSILKCLLCGRYNTELPDRWDANERGEMVFMKDHIFNEHGVSEKVLKILSRHKVVDGWVWYDRETGENMILKEF